MDASPDGRSHLVDFARQRLFPAQVGYLPGHHSSVRRRAAYARAHSGQGAAMTMTDHEQDDNTAPLPTVLRPRGDSGRFGSGVTSVTVCWYVFSLHPDIARDITSRGRPSARSCGRSGDNVAG